jgi:hypothetical protein
MAAGLREASVSYPDNLTECVFEQKRFWMEPAEINDDEFSLELTSYF